MSKADQIVLAEFGKEIVDIFEDYSNWVNVNENRTEIYERIADKAFDYGVKLDG